MNTNKATGDLKIAGMTIEGVYANDLDAPEAAAHEVAELSVPEFTTATNPQQ